MPVPPPDGDNAEESLPGTESKLLMPPAGLVDSEPYVFLEAACAPAPNFSLCLHK